MTDTDIQLILLDIDGILTHHHATPTDVLTAAQALAVSAIGDLCNKAAATAPAASRVRRGLPASEAASLHRAADAIAEQIRAALHARILEGPKPDW